MFNLSLSRPIGLIPFLFCAEPRSRRFEPSSQCGALSPLSFWEAGRCLASGGKSGGMRCPASGFDHPGTERLAGKRKRRQATALQRKPTIQWEQKSYVPGVQNWAKTRQTEHARSGVVFGQGSTTWKAAHPKTTPDPRFRRFHQEEPGRVLRTGIVLRLWPPSASRRSRWVWLAEEWGQENVARRLHFPAPKVPASRLAEHDSRRGPFSEDGRRRPSSGGLRPQPK
jgi:hypothetical protein